MLVAMIHPLNETEIRITGLRDIKDNEFESDKYIEVTQAVFNFIDESIHKSLLTYEYPLSGALGTDDIKVSSHDVVSEARNTALIKFKQRYLERSLDSEFYITFIEFTLLNNKLCAEGFYVTNDNREEAYLDILNTGNPDLIEALERYLNIIDKIAEYENMMTKFSEFKEDLHDAESVEEIKEVYNKHAYGDSYDKVILG